MKIFADKLGFPEGPVLLPDGGFLFVEMAEGTGWTIRFSADGKARNVLATTGRPNGLAMDRNGTIWVAETAMRAVLKMDLNGKYEKYADNYKGEKFLFLNDLAFAPNGDLYFTDSGVELEDLAPNGVANPEYRKLKYDGRVFRLDMKTREVERIDRGIEFTNGIAFGPDGHLYVAETMSGDIFRYACTNGRVTGKRDTFGNVIENFNPADLKGPDGMKFGADGSLYVAVFGQGDVTVLGKNGKVVKRIKVQGSMPTNLCFGPKGSRSIYVTEVETGSVQIHDAGSEGFPLYC